MKASGYKVRLEERRIVVEHRAPFGFRTVLLVYFPYIVFCLASDLRRDIFAFFRAPTVIGAVYVLLFLLLPLFFGWSWLVFNSGEVMICDSRELQFARRGIWARWRKQRFDPKRIRQLQKVVRGSSKNRNYSVLTFQYGPQTYDMLEELSPEDAHRVLQACKSFGVDVCVPPRDPGAAMLRDIQERGWFVNPLKPD